MHPSQEEKIDMVVFHNPFPFTEKNGLIWYTNLNIPIIKLNSTNPSMLA